MLTPRTIIVFLCWTCGLSFFCHTAYAQSSTPPPMRPGNGSELEIKGGELSWPRTEQLPSSTPNDRFMQKKLNEHLESASLNIMRPSTMFPTMPFGIGVSYVGLLDPVEIYRNWQRKKRALRTKMVLMTLFGNTTRPLTKHETDSIKRSIEWKRNVPVSTIANPVQISTLLKNDTIVEPSKPKFTAPLFGKERPQMAIDTISAASSPKINETR